MPNFRLSFDVLRHVVNGLDRLHTVDIVHTDLNIMVIMDDYGPVDMMVDNLPVS